MADSRLNTESISAPCNLLGAVKQSDGSALREPVNSALENARTRQLTLRQNKLAITRKTWQDALRQGPKQHLRTPSTEQRGPTRSLALKFTDRVRLTCEAATLRQPVWFTVAPRIIHDQAYPSPPRVHCVVLCRGRQPYDGREGRYSRIVTGPDSLRSEHCNLLPLDLR